MNGTRSIAIFSFLFFATCVVATRLPNIRLALKAEETRGVKPQGFLRAQSGIEHRVLLFTM